MALINTFAYTKTSFDAERFLAATHNQFRVINSRPYKDPKGKLPDGITMNLQVMVDDTNYGIDKDGNPRENNVDLTFDVTVFSRDKSVKRGDVIRLVGFDAEHSYVIKFDLILRFANFEVLSAKKQPLSTQ